MKVSGPAPPPAPPPGRRGRAKWRRRAIILATFAGILFAMRLGWTHLARAAENWLAVEHDISGWRFRVWGSRRTGTTAIRFDSAFAVGSKLSIRTSGVELAWNWTPGSTLVPGGVSLRAHRLEVAPRNDTTTSPRDTSTPKAPTFPDLAIPASVHVRIDTFLLSRGSGADSGRILAQATGIEFHGSARSANLAIDHAETPMAAVEGRLRLDADWTDSDTLRLRLETTASPGNRPVDSIAGRAALSKADLRHGRATLKATVDGTRGWGTVLPALASAPALRDLELSVDGWSDGTHHRGEVSLDLSTDSLAFLPPLDLSLQVAVDGRDVDIGLAASKKDTDGANLDLDLHGTIPANGRIEATQAKGTIDISGLGMPGRFYHGFDGHIAVENLDRLGAKAVYTTQAGTVFHADAKWKGLHWNLEADVVPEEPWAVQWTDSLHMVGTGTIHGRDSAGGALFEVTARRPHILPVYLDSLHTKLWIGSPGPTLVFYDIVASDSGRRWLGSGRIAIRDSTVHFELAPQGDSLAAARLDATFRGHVRIVASDYPTTGLPLHLPFAPRFPMIADLEFEAIPKHPTGSQIDIRAQARGLPSTDSLVAGVELQILDSSIQIPMVSARLGSSLLEGKLAIARRDALWQLDTLVVRTGRFDLGGLNQILPSLPAIQGVLNGQVSSIRGEGVAADLRLDGPGILGKEGLVPLPDLLLWGIHDTLHLGGWYPAGNQRIPFRLTATRLWEPDPHLDLVAFWGDVLRVRANAVFEGKRRLQAAYTIDGSTTIAGTDARLRDFLATGAFDGALTPKGFTWKATAEGTRGTFQAIAGLPLELRFSAQADPAQVVVSKATLTGGGSATFDAQARMDLSTRNLSMEGHGRNLRLDLGQDRSLQIEGFDVSSGSLDRIDLVAQGVGWHQAWNQDERLDIHVPTAKLAYSQTKDWKKLSGDIQVDQGLFTRKFANPGALLSGAMAAMRGERRSEGASSTTPLRLDLKVNSTSDSIRISNNLGEGNLQFALEVSGPAEAPLLNGTVAADSAGGHFGYLHRKFAIDTLSLRWDNEPVNQGRFDLSGIRTIRRSCDEPTGTDLAMETCELHLTATGTLEDPRLRRLSSTCATQPGDDGTVGAALALATDCYPQQNSIRFGKVFKDQASDIIGDQGKGWINDVLSRQLENSRSDALWFPESLQVTDIPTGSARNQFGLMALYRLTPEIDLLGLYQHTFNQTITLNGSKPTLSDNYGLRFRYTLSFPWIEEPEMRARLERRVFLQADVGQSLDDNNRRQTIVQPSLRYRWEFW